MWTLSGRILKARRGRSWLAERWTLPSLPNILFQINDKDALAREIFRTLKNGGRVAVIDWDASFGGAGPAPKAVAPKTEAERIFIQERFLEEREFPAGDNHYGIIFKKP